MWQTVTVAFAPGRLLDEERRERLADDVAAPDDDHVLPGGVVAGAHEHLLHARRRRGQESRAALQEASAVDGVHPVNVLVRVYGEDDLTLLDVGGQRQLDEDAVESGVGVELPHERDQLFLRGLLRQLERLAEHLRLVAGAALVAHVDGGGGVAADEHGREAGDDAEALRERVRLLGDLAAYLLGHLLAIDNGRGHGLRLRWGCVR